MMYEIDIFVDIKSPLSYLILPQALQMMEDYHCIVTFKPYNLSYVDMGLTTSHDRNNPKRLLLMKDKLGERRCTIKSAVFMQRPWG